MMRAVSCCFAVESREKPGMAWLQLRLLALGG
jgi:hypothetical protein